MKFNGRGLPDGTVLLVGVKYPTSPKTYTYVLLRTGGYWYSTGQGPHAAGWPVIERWLERDGREVAWVRGTGQDAMPLLWPAEPVAAAPADVASKPTGRKYERDLDDELDGIPDVHGNYS